ncbi:unnamed protein product [Angiostrongylus costaricensis]|uniref:G_PROTEIN_RECEP_F1_2 domain-containing protein n=1 Tax=Angiostrongylus costaricensis TaxID=334426 RepID=A0A0R3Q1Y9_ANGCS|nr:unnamed protein product [Angiostrongylus costaricensis]
MVATGDSSLVTVSVIQPTSMKTNETHSTKRPDEDTSWTRYAVLCATIICLSSVMANMVCFNFTVLCMPATHEVLAANEVWIEISQ